MIKRRAFVAARGRSVDMCHVVSDGRFSLVTCVTWLVTADSHWSSATMANDVNLWCLTVNNPSFSVRMEGGGENKRP